MQNDSEARSADCDMEMITMVFLSYWKVKLKFRLEQENDMADVPRVGTEVDIASNVTAAKVLCLYATARKHLMNLPKTK